jgi:FMN phosphatase YigB (HAD superfamily)
VARKKKDEPGKGIIQFNPGKQDNNQPWNNGQDWEEEDWDEDEDDWDEEEIPEELMSALLGRLIGGGPGGMTNEQYKGMLLDSLQPWKEVLKLAQEAGNQKIIEKAKEQISLINRKLKF